MFFFFDDPATTEIYTLSLHDALPIRAGSIQISSRCTGSVLEALYSLWRTPVPAVMRALEPDAILVDRAQRTPAHVPRIPVVRHGRLTTQVAASTRRP